jgi:hypothetical protein
MPPPESDFSHGAAHSPGAAPSPGPSRDDQADRVTDPVTDPGDSRRAGAGSSGPDAPNGPAGRATARLAAYLADAGLAWEAGARPGEVVVTVPGERKLTTIVSLLVRDELTSVSAFVIRNPDENHAEVYRFLLRRVMRRPLLGYAVDAAGDVYARAQVPTEAVDAAYLDLLMGAVLEAADAPFNDLLVLGFLTSMKREWAWRVARGESLANLEAFRSILSGAEDDPAYAVPPLPPDPLPPEPLPPE